MHALLGGEPLDERGLPDEIIEALRKRSFSDAMVSDKPILSFDINVTADESINIHNRNLQTILSADLLLKGNNIVPQMGGQVNFPLLIS